MQDRIKWKTFLSGMVLSGGLVLSGCTAEPEATPPAPTTEDVGSVDMTPAAGMPSSTPDATVPQEATTPPAETATSGEMEAAPAGTPKVTDEPSDPTATPKDAVPTEKDGGVKPEEAPKARR